MKVFKWIIGILIGLVSILWIIFFGFFLLTAIAFSQHGFYGGSPTPYANLPGTILVLTVEVLLLLATSIMSFWLLLHRFGVDRKKDRVLIYLMAGFAVAAAIVGYLLVSFGRMGIHSGFISF
ncbi:MAG: hypothetical protein NTZ34_06850 [Chloroflexi bacterium]|nr:hypothetical protein [Chloroflexota bacterium]